MLNPSVGNVSSSTYSAHTQSASGSARKDLKGLDNALLTGDLGGAQSFFSMLQNAVGNTAGSNQGNSIPSQATPSNSSLGKDMQAVSGALSSNDLGGAQKAFARFQQDIESASQAGGSTQAHGRHLSHHAGMIANDADSSQSASLAALLLAMSGSQSSATGSTDLIGALQSIEKSNPKVASDLQTLIADLNKASSAVNTKA